MYAKKDNCLSPDMQTINDNIGSACVIRKTTVLFTTDKQCMTTSFENVNLCARKTTAVFDKLSTTDNIGSACVIRKITVLCMTDKQCMTPSGM